MARVGSAAQRVRRSRPLALLLVAGGMMGCMLVDAITGGAKPFVFSHKVHVTGESMECGDCHTAWQEADDPGLPGLAGCKLCHDNIDKDKPPERRVETLYRDGKYLATGVARLSDEVVFSHKRHVTDQESCKTCHTGIEEDETLDPRLAVTMSECSECHTTRKVANECATCHREIRSDVAPRTHEKFWSRQHGKVVRAHSNETVDDCSLCHQETQCTSCHLDQMPESHNNYFRRRGHGLLARMDRDQCAACHRTDMCDSCHRETRPTNHVGQWGAGRSTHCLNCHEPLSSSDCSVCHKSTPSHQLATPLPPGHNAAMNCRQCHGNGQPLPHVDKGDQCTNCHR